MKKDELLIYETRKFQTFGKKNIFVIPMIMMRIEENADRIINNFLVRAYSKLLFFVGSSILSMASVVCRY